MLSIIPFDLTGVGLENADAATECTLWSGRSGQLCAQYFRSQTDVVYPPHSHSEYTLFVCLAGEILVGQMGLEQTLGAGDAVIGCAGVPHYGGYRPAGGRACEAVAIALDCQLMAALTADFGQLHWQDTTRPAFAGKVNSLVLLGCAREIARELKENRPAQDIIVENLAIRLLIETVRLWPVADIGPVQADSAPRLSHRDFVRAYEFMRLCRKESFRLQLLCRYLGTSEERFTRLFLASTNQTPANFYNRLLMDRASSLLANPRLSVKEIGFDLGFKTSSHFIASFRRISGVSPQKYRRQQPGKPAPVNRLKPAKCF